MKTEFQNLEWAIPKIQKQFIKNPRKSISATFRFLRNHPRYTLIGDYPILSIIVDTIRKLGIKPFRRNLLYGLNSSEEFKIWLPKEKSELLDELLRSISVSFKGGKIANS